MPRPWFFEADALTASLRPAEWRRQKTKQSTRKVAQESGSSHAENARTTGQCARAAWLASQAVPQRACPQWVGRARLSRLENRVGLRRLSAERLPSSQAAPPMECDENRGPSAAAFRPAAPVSAPAAPRHETSETIRQQERLQSACSAAGAAAWRATAPASADRF